MKRIIRSAAVAAVLAVASVGQAFAALTLPSTGDSAATLVVWDTQNQRSLTVALNVDYSDLLPSVIATASGYSLSNALTAAGQSAVADFVNSGGDFTWWVAAADSQGLGNFGGRSVLTTGLSALTGIMPSITNQGVTTAANRLNTFYTNVNNYFGDGFGVASGAASSDSFLAYGGDGINNLGPRWASVLPAAIQNGADIGGTLGFYQFSTPESAGAISASQATKVAYGNAAGFGAWSLVVSGTNAVLSYTLSAVPLPAAAWLFISGLLGLVTIGRRSTLRAPEAVAA